MIEDLVTIERGKLERILARSRAWKLSAKQWRKSSDLQAGFAEEWHQGYRRAWKLDDPPHVVDRAFSLVGWALVGASTIAALAALIRWIR